VNAESANFLELNDFPAPHNPKVGGSNPPPAIKEAAFVEISRSLEAWQGWSFSADIELAARLSL
jgi:hypothetical protein